MNERKYEEFVDVITASLKKKVASSPGWLSLKPGAHDRIKALYESCRQQMKKRMALVDQSKSWDQQRLDRHKVAAAVCWAITRAEPIEVKANAGADDRVANESVAFSAPLQILLSFAADDAEKDGKPALADFFRGAPFLPATTDEYPFSVHAVRSLYWQRLLNAKADADIAKWLDPFQLAIMYFMLEFCTSQNGENLLIRNSAV